MEGVIISTIISTGFGYGGVVLGARLALCMPLSFFPVWVHDILNMSGGSCFVGV